MFGRERRDEIGEGVRTRHDAAVSGALENGDARVRYQRGVTKRRPNRHDAIQDGVAGDYQRRHAHSAQRWRLEALGEPYAPAHAHGEDGCLTICHPHVSAVRRRTQRSGMAAFQLRCI